MPKVQQTFLVSDGSGRMFPVVYVREVEDGALAGCGDVHAFLRRQVARERKAEKNSRGAADHDRGAGVGRGGVGACREKCAAQR